MRIKRKGWFCLGVFNILLALVNIILKISGNGTELALVAILVCTISGISAIVDSLEWGMKMKSREEILSCDFSTDMEHRNCGDCKHYFYFVGEAGCELNSTSYPELCENFTPDDEKEFVSEKDGADDSSHCCYSGIKCYADDCGTCKERTDCFIVR